MTRTPLHRMRNILFSFLLVSSGVVNAQVIDSLNTAKNCLYMRPEEREMIYELNRLRSNPRSYLPYIEPLLKTSKNYLKNFGKGVKSYSLTFTTHTVDGKESKKIDTNWHYSIEER